MLYSRPLRLRFALFLGAILCLSPLSIWSLPTSAPAESENPQADPVKLLTVITSANAETQFMALVLTMQAARQGAVVRILLCDEGGNLALEGKSFAKLEPLGRSPRDLLEGLIKAGAMVDVCAIFLPNRDYVLADLVPGVGVARPDEIASYMLQEGVRYFSF